MDDSKADGDVERVEFLPSPVDIEPKNQQSDTNTAADIGVPVDRGWAWVVLIGAVVSMAIVLGAWRTTGIFFIIFQEKFQSSASTTSIIPSIQNAAFSLTGPVIMTVGIKVLSCRQFVIIGGLMAVISYLINAATNHIAIVIVAQGIIQGIGYGMCEPCVISIVTKHFKKRRSLANSITAASGSLGGFIFPALVTFLHRFYGYFGCMLFLSAINLNVSAVALIFRPESFYKRKTVTTMNREFLLNLGSGNGSSQLKKTTFGKSILEYFDYKLFANPLFNLFQISFALLCGALYMNIYFVPPLAKEFGIDKTNIAIIVTLFAAVDLCFRIITGVIADTGICRRSTYLAVCFFIFGINSHLIRFYTSFELLLVYVLIQGATGRH